MITLYRNISVLQAKNTEIVQHFITFYLPVVQRHRWRGWRVTHGPMVCVLVVAHDKPIIQLRYRVRLSAVGLKFSSALNDGRITDCMARLAGANWGDGARCGGRVRTAPFPLTSSSTAAGGRAANIFFNKYGPVGHRHRWRGARGHGGMMDRFVAGAPEMRLLCFHIRILLSVVGLYIYNKQL